MQLLISFQIYRQCVNFVEREMMMVPIRASKNDAVTGNSSQEVVLVRNRFQ
jgi:hypothetical protein